MADNVATFPGPDISHPSGVAGPLLLGYILNAVLFGALTVQVSSYSTTFMRDPLLLQCLVYFVYAAEVAQTVTFLIGAFSTFVYDFGQPRALIEFNIGWLCLPILSSLVEAAAQLLYAYRIKVLTGSKKIPTVVVTLCAIQFIGMVGTTIRFATVRGVDKYFTVASYVLAGLWEISSAVCDLIIAVVMSWSLHTKRSTLLATNNVVAKVLRIIVWTGSFSATIAILTLLFTWIPGIPPYYMTTGSIISKAYSTSIMALLNSRSQSRKVIGVDHLASEDLEFAAAESTRRDEERSKMTTTTQEERHDQVANEKA